MKSLYGRAKRRTLHALEGRLLLSSAMPAFETVEPVGAMAYRSTAFGITDAAPGGVTGPFTFRATQGQPLAVSVEPSADSLDVPLELRDPSGNLVALSNARGSAVGRIADAVVVNGPPRRGCA
jgi:hypothetical protein